MSVIEIYGRTEPSCPFCVQAKNMLNAKELEFTFKDITHGEWDKTSLEEQLGVTISTVPVVVIDGKFLGGAKELHTYLRGI